jgi:hypothetical protein
VWTCVQQPEPVRFFVELYQITPSGSREIHSRFTETSSMKVTLPETGESFAWRVMAVAQAAGRYVTSEWSYLHRP